MARYGLPYAFRETDLGVGLLGPFSDARFLAPLRILPNTTWPSVLSAAGLGQLALEFALFLPLWLYAFLPRQRSIR